MALIYEAIPKIMSEVGAIEKNRKGDGVSYKFRGIDDLYKALQPLLAKYNVFVVPEVLDRHREERTNAKGTIITYTILRIKHTFFASDGSFISSVTDGEAMDTSDKSSNKAMSAAMKYALIEVFCIPTEEPKDTEENHHETISKKEINLKSDIKNKKEPQSLEEIPPPKFTSWFPTEKQLTRLFAIAKKSGYDSESAGNLMRKKYNITSSKELTHSQYEELCFYLEQNPITELQGK